MLNLTADYDAFIILHGTDTMSYTASILSFAIENLNKTIILTGAQSMHFAYDSSNQLNSQRFH